MATISTDRMEVAKTISGNSPFTMSFLEAATQTFKKGDVVTFDANGFLTVGTGSEDRVVGVAAEDGHNGAAAGSTACVVWVACDDIIFRANTNAVGNQNFIGKAFVLNQVSTKWVVDTNAGVQSTTANKRVILLRFDPRDLITDTNVRCEFQFHPVASAFSYTS